jgi:short-subunit dehydrogenase
MHIILGRAARLPGLVKPERRPPPDPSPARQPSSPGAWVEELCIKLYNVLSGVRLTRHYLPGMLEQNWGRVIFLSSESAQQTPAEMVRCGMTTTAQIAIARGIAESVVGTGVAVNSVMAGPTASEGVGRP